jgi:two-component system, NtrC family, response regulator AtoC
MQGSAQPIRDRSGIVDRRRTSVVWGTSAAMRSLRRIVDDTAVTDIPVLIVGESGTGKEALARYIHEMSPRNELPFVKINCRTFNTLHKTNGASMGLHDSENGHAESVGTLMLDVICELEAEGQRQLLDLLPEPVLGAESSQTSPRIISTARHSLEDNLKAGKLLEEFYFRLNGVCVRIPALRDHKEDVPEFVEFFLSKYEELFARTCERPDGPALHKLANYSWPGNVRQLENAMRKLVITGDIGGVLEDLVEIGGKPSLSGSNGKSVSLKAASRAASRQAEKELLSNALTRTHWNRKRAAQELQISYKALLYKLKQLGLEDSEIS